ncbi:MAG: DUF3800 domain-containing protein [Patescibacteria group bacterium]|jgi:hypothetical protein
MIIFIDESGDPGFKIARGSSPYFVIALVVFKNDLDAEEAAIRIKRLKQKLQKSDRFEFKFNGCSRSYREAFLHAISDIKYEIRAIVINKPQIYSTYLQTSKESFYNFSLRQILQHNNNTIRNAKIRIDGRGERAFRTQLSTYLRQHLNSTNNTVMKNIRFRDSSKDVLVQMADMIAGTIRRYFDKMTEDWNIYRKIIKSKEKDIWVFK